MAIHLPLKFYIILKPRITIITSTLNSLKRFFLDDLDIRDVYKIDDRAILVGSDAQILIYQNIYHGKN